MFDSLRVGSRYNIGLFLFFVLLKVLFFEMSLWSLFALSFSAFQFSLLFESLGKVIPVRHLFGSFMCLQMLVGPALAYNGLDQFQVGHFKMQIPESDYFYYVLPSVVLFVLGLHLKSRYYEGEKVDVYHLEQFLSNRSTLPFIFIAVGFVATFLSQSIGTGLTFVFYLLGGLKFIGLFLIILTSKRFNFLTTFLVYGSVILSSVATAMFHDLLTWGIFLLAIFCVKYKPSNVIKLTLLLFFVFISVFIQLIKGEYREVTWKNEKEGDIETLGETVQEQVSSQELFSLERLAQSNVRINQGAIITNIMNYIPEKKAFAEGAELVDVLEAAIMPRFLSENKLTAGNREFFMKWSGMVIGRGVSMGLSSVGDAYINFGVLGGIVFMFFYGLLFNRVLLYFHKKSNIFPVLMVLTPLVFYYPIRPDSELHTLLGHLIKSCFLIFVIIQIWKPVFFFQRNESLKS